MASGVLRAGRRLSGRAAALAVGGMVALGFAALAVQVVQMETAAPPAVRLGSPAPDFTLPAQDGRRFHLADYTGRAVFLAFVPTLESGAARDEARALAGTMAQFDAAGAKVFLVVDASADAATTFHDTLGLPFPVLLDEDRALARRYGVPPDRPETVTVDPKGKLKFHIRAVETARHGAQLLEITKCCIDDVLAARVTGVGKPVADYSLLRASDQGMERVYGDRSQQVTVALFLSVKCPCSNAYNERVRALANAYSGKSVRFVAIYSNSDETDAQIAAHAKAHGIAFPALRDAQALAADHFHATITPQAFVMDRDGVLRYAGRIDESREAAEARRHDLRDAIEAVLAKKKAPEATPGFGCAIVRPRA